MSDSVDYKVINATYDAISPIIKANGKDKNAITRYVYYLLIIAAAIADQLGVSADQFKALSASAFDAGRQPLTSSNLKTN